jgi:TM2 domain-containing membrane protein YozV
METSKPREEWNQPQQPFHQQKENKKFLAGILALLIGGSGAHKFVLGYTQEGFIQLFLSIITCGFAGIIPLIEGIIYLTRTNKDFYETYQVHKRPWF